MCKELGKLVALADIITQNLTEACHLTDMPYKAQGWKRKELYAMAQELACMGPSRVVITGIPQGEFIANFVYVKEPKTDVRSGFIRIHKAGAERCGTGDVFASIIAADAVKGVPFDRSVRKASGFVKKCIIASLELQTPPTDGVPFEEILYQLKRD